MIVINRKNIEIIEYPNGEIGIKNLSVFDNDERINIKWNVENLFKEIFILQLIQYRFKNKKKLYLYTDYLPFSREDKIINDQLPTYEILYKDLLNNFSKIVTIDNHSIKNDSIIESQRERWINELLYRKIFLDFVHQDKRFLTVFPDESSFERYKNIVFRLNDEGEIDQTNTFYAIFKKERNDYNGKINKMSIKEINSFKDKKPFNLLIIDDICSFGGTFVNSVKMLKKLFPNRIQGTILLTTYDEDQEKNKDFKRHINNHYFLKTINFKDNKKCEIK